MKMIDFKGKKYAFDFNKIMEFVDFSRDMTSTEREILDTYDISDGINSGGKVVTKTIRELVSPSNFQMDSIRYDLVKTFIIEILSFEGDFEREATDGLKIAINTLINEKLLVEIK